MSYEALFNPIKIRGLELKNRVVLPGMNTKMVIKKHGIGEDMIAYHVAKAKAGCALNIFEVAAVCPEPHAYMYMGLYTDKDVEELRKLTDAVHEVGGLMGIQLWHGGFTPQLFFDESNKLETPDTCTVERLQEIEVSTLSSSTQPTAICPTSCSAPAPTTAPTSTAGVSRTAAVSPGTASRRSAPTFPTPCPSSCAWTPSMS